MTEYRSYYRMAFLCRWICSRLHERRSQPADPQPSWMQWAPAHGATNATLNRKLVEERKDNDALTCGCTVLKAVLKRHKQSVGSEAGVKFANRRKTLSTSAKALRAGFHN